MSTSFGRSWTRNRLTKRSNWRSGCSRVRRPSSLGRILTLFSASLRLCVSAVKQAVGIPPRSSYTQYQRRASGQLEIDMNLDVRATYIGGPSVLLEVAGLRLLTDPNFDPAGSSYETPVYTLHKSTDPGVAADALGAIDAVLLSHDHHFDNLDRAGRAMLARANRTLTPTVAAERLGGNAVGLAPWQTTELANAAGE